MKVALAGLSLAGKTTLFDALSQHAVESQAHPARADHPNVAAVKIPDERVDWLVEHEKSQKKVYATMELMDLPGIALGEEAGAADRPRITGHLRQADAIVYCLRTFKSSAVPPFKGVVDAKRDYQVLRSEFLISDLDTVMRRLEKIEQVLKKPLPKKEAEQYHHEQALLEKCRAALEAEQPLRPLLEHPEDAALVSGFCFLTQKPVIIVLNIGEDDIGRETEVAAGFADLKLPVYAICARSESDILQLSAEDRPVFMEDLRLKELGSRRLVHDIHQALDEIVFLTTGPDETRAWPIPVGSSALAAAGAIHSDLARGFIRAEVFTYQDLHDLGSEKAIRAAGKFRLEGKEYIVKDGNVLVIRFNV